VASKKTNNKKLNFETRSVPDNDPSKKQTSVKSFKETLPDWRKWCEYWRSYPDRFVDHIRPPNSKVKLYFYQRIMLRILFRYQKVYFVLTRGSAKSYTQILAMYLKCIMYPDTHLFIAAPTKQQASNIAKENIERIWEHLPLLQKEVKQTIFQNDYTKLIFHNGSSLDVVQVAQSSRGGRRNGGAVEEIVDDSMKKDVLNEVVIPMMANDRIATCGGKDPNEPHKFQFYITTSGTKQSFAYEKLQEVIDEMVNPSNLNYGKSFVLGAGYRLGCLYGQLDEEFIQSLKLQPTFNPMSFAREYESIWTGTSDNSLVTIEDLQKCRTLTKAEYRNMDRSAEYILSYDVARSEGNANATSALCVFKITPRGDGTYIKHLVNVFSMEGTHFLEQALFLKKKVNEYKASMVVVDANGLGTGLIDQLVLEIDENPPYSVVNDERYDRFKRQNSIPMVFALKSTNKDTKSSDIHNVFMNSIANHDIKIPHTESQARLDIHKKSDSIQVAKQLLPFVMTDRLADEIMNLEYSQSGNNTIVKQISKKINKDKFSAMEYGLFYIHLLERKNKSRQRETITDISKMFAFKAPKYKLHR